jgi:hypothetical protein
MFNRFSNGYFFPYHFFFSFSDIDPNKKLRVEAFIKQYLDFIAKFEAEVLDPANDLDKRSES